MIENSATNMELVYQLGHLNQSTVIQYYAKVKSARLADNFTAIAAGFKTVVEELERGDWDGKE